MRPLALLPLMLVVACSPVPFEGADTGETDTGVDETDNKGSDSDSGEDTEDTWTETGDTATESGDTGDTGPQPLGCHPYDPMVTGGWQRVYSVTEGSQSGTETQNGLGPQALPTGWPGQGWTPSQAYAYTSSVRVGGNTRPLQTVYNTCQNSTQSGLPGEEAVEVGFTEPNGSLNPIFVVAKSARMYLPPESAFQGLGLSATVTANGRATAQSQSLNPFACVPAQPPCILNGTYNIAYNAEVTTLGSEQINIQGLGTVEAEKVSYVVTQQFNQVVTNPFSAIFGSIFGNFLTFGGLQNTGDNNYQAEVTRWYVRGVGLVKEQALDIQASTPGNPVVRNEKVMTSCSGLPACP